MREHAAGLLKHSKNVTWSKMGAGVRTRHHRTGLFLGYFFVRPLTLTLRQFPGRAFLRGVIFVLFLSYDTPFSKYL